jgi:hypothetical protein
MMSMKLVQLTSMFVIVCVCIMGSFSVGMAQSSLDIRGLMTPQEFTDAGLHTLNTKELDALNEWLNVYTITLVELIRNLEAEEPPTPSRVIESRVKGTFEGWDGETVFELQNGQTWQQDSYSYTYHYAYSPKVTIYPEGTRFKMKVEGVSAEIYVKRIK